MKPATAKKPVIRIAIVESDPLRLVGFRTLFDSEPEFELVSASIAELTGRENIDLVLLGSRSGQNSFDTMASLKAIPLSGLSGPLKSPVPNTEQTDLHHCHSRQNVVYAPSIYLKAKPLDPTYVLLLESKPLILSKEAIALSRSARRRLSSWIVARIRFGEAEVRT